MFAFEPVKQTRVAGNVIDQLKEAIITGHYRTGDKLPSERDLANSFQVSRLAIREALHTLESSGFIATRKGIGGGIFVTDLTFDHLVNAFLDLFQMEKISIPALHQVRLLVETEVARLAAMNVTPKYTTLLQEALDAEELPMRSNAEHLDTKSRVHFILAEMCENPFLEALVRTIMIGTRKVLEFLQTDPDYMHPAGIHRPIVEAVLAGNPELAAKAMRNHGRIFGEKLIRVEHMFRSRSVHSSVTTEAQTIGL